MTDPAGNGSPIDLSAGRLEAFSDAVMAVIITLLAFELRPPESATWSALSDRTPAFAITS